MKKIDIQNSLRERVESTEWTDKDTWNVLDRVRATGKTREKHRLTFLIPAAAMLILAVCIGVTSIVNPGTPDRIRDSIHTIQPLANTLSGNSASGSGDEITDDASRADEEAAIKSLRDCYPEIADALRPVNAVCEDQGIRVEIVSALVKGNSSWILWTMQDLEGSRINESSAGIFNHPNNIGEVADYGYSYSFYNAEEKKLTVLEEIRYDSMNEPEDGLYLLNADSVYTYEYETVDLKPLLEKYKSTTEGVNPPSGAWPLSGIVGDPVPQDLKVLDYESPANVSLTGKGRLLLTGIGWIGGKLHVQIHEADPAFCGTDDDGVSQVRNNSILISNCSGKGEPFGQSGDSPYAWKGSEGRWDEWLEFVFESTPDDEETMTLSAELVYSEKAAAGRWEFTIPVSAIRTDTEGACEKHLLEALKRTDPEIAEEMRPVHYASEHDGIRMEIVSAVIRGNESWMLCTLQDLEGGKISGNTCDVLDRYNNIGSIDSYPDYFTYYSADENKFGFLEHIRYTGIDEREDGIYTFGVNSICDSRSEVVDLIPLLQQYGKTTEGIDAPEDITLYCGVDEKRATREQKILDYTQPLNIPLGTEGKVFLTGIGWIDNQLHVQVHEEDPEFSVRVGNVEAWMFCMGVYNYTLNGGTFAYADINPLRWRNPEKNWDRWEEFVLESTPEDLSAMTLKTELIINSLTATGRWEVQVPASLIRTDD